MDGQDRDVLMIEDDAALAEMYALRLGIDGYSVAHAADGESGLSLALGGHPNLITLDVELPGISGFEVLRRLRHDEWGASVPVIVASNYSDAATVDQARELGAVEHLVKANVTPREFADRVAYWLAR